MQIKLCPSGSVDWKFVELGYPSLALGLLTEGGERHFSPLGMREEVPQVSQSFCLVFFCWVFFLGDREYAVFMQVMWYFLYYLS